MRRPRAVDKDSFKTKTDKIKIKYATVAQLVEQTFAGETTAAGGR